MLQRHFSLVFIMLFALLSCYIPTYIHNTCGFCFQIIFQFSVHYFFAPLSVYIYMYLSITCLTCCSCSVLWNEKFGQTSVLHHLVHIKKQFNCRPSVHRPTARSVVSRQYVGSSRSNSKTIVAWLAGRHNKPAVSVR